MRECRQPGGSLKSPAAHVYVYHGWKLMRQGDRAKHYEEHPRPSMDHPIQVVQPSVHSPEACRRVLLGLYSNLLEFSVDPKECGRPPPRSTDLGLSSSRIPP